MKLLFVELSLSEIIERCTLQYVAVAFKLCCVASQEEISQLSLCVQSFRSSQARLVVA